MCYARILRSQLLGASTHTICDGHAAACAGAIEYTSPLARYLAVHPFQKVLASIAASLSSLGLTDADNVASVSGVASASEPFVQVAFYWLVFPLALNFCGIVFLCLAIRESRRQLMKPWKTSILPLLYHGLEFNLLSTPPQSEDVSAMERLAEKTSVQLAYSSSRNRTMLKQA